MPSSQRPDFVTRARVEEVLIDQETDVLSFVQQLRWNSAYHRLAQRL
jgi:L-arabinose isomerase